ncbi:MAG: LysE family translocator [Sphingomonadales bacterium]
MTLDVYAAFLLASVLLAIIPGPNVALVVATSLKQGRSQGLQAVAGTSSGQFIQLSVAVAGLTTLAVFLAELFEWIRWFGVAYLLYLAAKSWRADPALNQEKVIQSRYFSQGFFVALINPKTLMFHGAFLPQCINSNSDVFVQSVFLATSFLIVVTAIDVCFVLLASWVKPYLVRANGRMLAQRLGACVYAGAAAGLALARR